MRHFSNRSLPPLSIALLVISCFAQPIVAQSGALRLPPIPADSKFVQDYAKILDDDTLAKIGDLQRVSYSNNQIPIVVVTIQSRT